MRLAEVLRAGFVQTGPVFGDVAGNLERAGRMVREAPPFDVLVLPELFACGYAFRDRAEAGSLAEGSDGPTVRAMASWARERGGWVAGGFAERAGQRVFNAAALVGPGGERHVYRKVHLFDTERSSFDPGDAPFRAVDLQVSAGTVRVGLMICFDWIFPESMRSLVLDGAEVVLHPSNLVKPWCQDAMVTRCLENGAFAVTANRVGQDDRGGGLRLRFTGRSQITAPRGGIVVRADEHGECVRVETIDLAVARDKRVTRTNDLLADRRPDAYRTDARANGD